MKQIFLAVVALMIVPILARAESVTITSTADTYVNQMEEYRNMNSGSATVMVVAGPMSASVGLLKFDLSQIPSGSVINRASMRIYLRAAACNDMKFWLYRVTSSWSENVVTYLTRPGITYQDASSVTINSPSGYKTWDVTNMVKGWYGRSYSNHGVELAYDVMEECHCEFFTREGTYKPQLIVEYTPPPDRTPPQISNVWAQPNATDVYIRWKTSNEESSSRVKFKKATDRSWSEAATDEMVKGHTVLVSAISPATTYQYKVQSQDWDGNLAESGVYEFSTRQAASSSAPTSSPSSPNTPPPASGGSNGGSNNNEEQQVYNVIADVTGPNSVRIKWWSHLLGTTWAFYSKTANDSTPITEYEPPVGRNDELEEHEVFIDGLSPATTYSYRVMSKSSNNQMDISNRFTFTTYRANGSGNNGQNTNSNADSTQNNSGNSSASASNSNTVSQSQSTSTLEEVQQEADALLNGKTEEGTTDEYTEAKKLAEELINESKQSANWRDWVLFIGMRLLFPILLLLLLLLIIFLRKKKRKEKKEEAAVPAETGATKTDAKAETEPKKKTQEKL